MKKNIFLFATSIILSFVFFYFAYVIYNYLNIDKYKTTPFETLEELNFHKKYSKKLHHLRDIKTFNNYFRNPENSKNNYLFTILSDFKNEKINILLQGDSWSEQFLTNEKTYKNAIKYIQTTTKDNNMGFINAGVTSYSPTLMRLQMDFLEKDFGIKPNIVVAYIDQTDLGDENCRYKDSRIFIKNKLVGIKEEKFSGRPFDFTKNYELSEILLENKSKKSIAIKISNHNLFFGLKKNTIKNKNKIIRIFEHGWGKRNLSKCYWPEISSYLNKSNEKEISYFKRSVLKYLESLEKRGYVKKVIIVTFPHLNNLKVLNGDNKNLYSNNVSDIIDEILPKKDKFIHLNFTKLIYEKKVNIEKKDYKTNDPASHLKPEYYSNIFLKQIMQQILN